MTVQIRAGMFETNSSSTHSLGICDNPKLLKLNVLGQQALKDGFVCIEGGEYGWEVEDYYDFYSKCSYLITDTLNSALDGVDEKPEYVSLDNIDEYANADIPRFKRLANTVQDVLGVELRAMVSDKDGYYPFGYIDHQSSGETGEVWESDRNLFNFLFNTASFVHTDNDNH